MRLDKCHDLSTREASCWPKPLKRYKHKIKGDTRALAIHWIGEAWSPPTSPPRDNIGRLLQTELAKVVIDMTVAPDAPFVKRECPHHGVLFELLQAGKFGDTAMEFGHVISP